MDLRHLTDRVLLKDIKALVTREREVTSMILHHLREIEVRKAYSDLGFSSLFDYCVRELGYSEPAASRRVNASRLIKDFPDLEEKINSGALTLTNMAEASKFFRDEGIVTKNEKKEILSSIENQTKKECEKTLALFSNKEAVKKMCITVEEDTFKLFCELKGILAHRNFNDNQLMKHVFHVAREVIENKRFGLNSKATPPAESTLRYIPASVKKEVYKRDLGKCQKCGGMYKIEFDHLLPHALGGKTSVENLRLLCFSCNQRKRIEAGL